MQATNREITVRGIGKVSVAPDLIMLKMDIETVDVDYETTMNCATKLLDTLRSAVESAGHDGRELKTTSFNVDTKYEQYKVKEEWKSRFIGYSCAHGLKLEFNLDMQMLGATLGAIAECDAKPKLKINFSVKDTNAVSEQLLQSAIENAKSKAKILARSAGVALGEIKRIDYNWSEIHIHSDTDVEAEMMLCEMRIEPEAINANDSATVVWAIG